MFTFFQYLFSVVNGINEFGPSIIRRLPGQKSAPAPECPACGLKTRCRLKLEGHLLEHEDNPLVVCNHENCETAFALHELTQHEKDYHPDVCLICEMCNEMFDNKTTLVQHYKLHISKKVLSIQNLICFLIFFCFVGKIEMQLSGLRLYRYICWSFGST